LEGVPTSGKVWPQLVLESVRGVSLYESGELLEQFIVHDLTTVAACSCSEGL